MLVSIGVDQAYDGWNAPVDAEGWFVYVPISVKQTHSSIISGA
jgi:hypothetical protein